jgi:hypothetical protein
LTLPAGYILPTTKLTVGSDQFPGQVGVDYHFALGTFSSPALANPDRVVGFVLAGEEAQGKGWEESTDLNAKSSLTQFSSPNLTDRDFVDWPRESQGDFSNGGLQEIGLDLTKYFDADLDPHVPGYLTLRSQWLRQVQSVTAGPGGGVVAWNGDFWYSFGEANKRFYSVNGGAVITGQVVASYLATDGAFLYYSDGSTIVQRSSAGVEVVVGSALTGTATMIWVADLGTNGDRLFYLSSNGSLYFIDLTAGFPQSGVQFPPAVGSRFKVVDLHPYQNGVAILTTDLRTGGFDVWFHDLQNMTRYLRVDGYTGVGLAVCFGNLYVAAQSVGGAAGPILAQVSSGSFQIVAKPGSPFPFAGQTCGGPIGASNYVYWPIFTPSLKGISGAAPGYVVQFNVLTGAVSHLPVQDATDMTTPVGPGSVETLAAIGDSVGICFLNGSNGTLQYQASAFGATTFQPSGWVAGSLLDFGTPGIQKLNRKITIHHSPLRAGEQIVANAYIDVDPLVWSTGLATTSTVTNAALGSSVTTLSFPDNTQGNKGFVALQLVAGTGNATAPTVYWYSWEITTPYTWTFVVNCTHAQTLLSGRPDEQGLRGIDKYFFLRQLWPVPGAVILYHPSKLQVNVVVESVGFWHRSPVYLPQDLSGGPDLEFFATIKLREAAA